ncbi:hypothetical protein D3C71_1241460 [compost metagenome]
MSRVHELLQLIHRSKMPVYRVEVVSMIAVIGICTLLSRYRCNPDGCKAKVLDVIQLINNALEVPAVPFRRIALVRCKTVRIIIGGISIIETVGHDEVNALFAPVGSDRITTRITCRCSG